MTLTRDIVEQHLSDIEGRVLARQSSGCIWMGINISWERGAKKNGCTLKRGKAYGRFKYENYLTGSGTGEELTRGQVIAELMKPASLRQAAHDLTYIWTCSICENTIIGREEVRKGRHILRWGKKEIYICEGCLDAIAEGRVKLVI